VKRSITPCVSSRRKRSAVLGADRPTSRASSLTGWRASSASAASNDRSVSSSAAGGLGGARRFAMIAFDY